MKRANDSAERHPVVDMSPEAIGLRLRELAQLHRLGMSLRNGRWLGPLEKPDHRPRD